MAEATEASGRDFGAGTSPLHLRRARVACKACNARRVKCDAADGQPCWHCRIRRTRCELIESQRGKYARKKQRVSRDQAVSRDTTAGQSIQPPLQETASEGDRHGVASRHCVGSNEDRPPDQETGVDEFDTIFAGPDSLRRTTEPQADQTRRVTRAYGAAKSSRVSYIVEVVYRSDEGLTESLKVHYSIPASIAERPASDLGPRATWALSLPEALVMPAKEVADQLIRAFFEVIHPAYPVFDRREFTRQYLRGEASPLALQTIYLLGFTIGSESLVHAAGYSDRVTARKTHYLRAKALYDADYETDPVIVVACLLLLGFWWAGHEEQKDTCYWVGCSVIAAQSLKMHRSSSHSAKSPREKSLRKRIWWSIYVRDRHTAAAFGQPCRIRDEDCDVEPLTQENFSFDDGFDERLIPAQESFHVSYAVEMAKLTMILGDILVKEFSPRPIELEKFDTEALEGRLAQWECQLPNELRRAPPSESLGAPFWASMLHFSYQNYFILLFRPKSIEVLSSADAERDVRVRSAADSITRMAEDLLGTGAIKSAQIHLVPALFGALSAHTIAICRRDHVRQQLAENKARQCLLALSELSKSWPVKIWIANAFVDLMERLTGQVSSGGSIVSVSTRTTSSCSHPPHQAATPRTAGETLAASDIGQYVSSAQRDVHGCEHPPRAADPAFHDPVWSGFLDNNTFDIDYLLHTSLDPALSSCFEGRDSGEGVII